ncbi:MAG: hypothetical protein IJ635_05970 [Bacteroidaceae bacterium]|nr:hypothetical protein [Bacteroidaceae bacterium]MBR1520764.1 hypothetical protein [Bacteroidaceae bacterium]
MKKVLYLIGFVAATLLTSPASAQEKIFDHLAIGAEVGTTGWGFEVAAPLTHYVTLRTGFTTFPRISFNTDVDYTTKGTEKNVDITGRIRMSDYKFLADIYPFKNSSFHVTGGFYAGIPDLAKIYNTGVIEVDPGEGLEIGGVFIHPDNEGLVNLKVQTKSFKPYVGLGFGRPISSKHKIGTAFDLGVMFWGKPAVKVYSPDEEGWVKVDRNDVDDEDFHDAIKTIEGIGIYPVLNFRIYYNIF